MKGAKLVIETLSNAGVTKIFGLSGNQIMSLYDAAIGTKIELVHVRQEAAAAFMAEAWAQLTGEIGVALIAGGPAFSNGLGSLYAVRASETPVILLAGDGPVDADGTGAFQEVDQVAIAKALVKASRRSTSANDLGNDVAWAIKTAQSGRPGPIHLALPSDLLEDEAGDVTLPAPESFASDQPSLDTALIGTVAAALQAAERPLIILGPSWNATRAGAALLGELADATDAPVVPMESPRGLIDPTLGSIAHSFANADLILSIGKSIDFTLRFGKDITPSDCKWIVIDPETKMLDRAKLNLGDRLTMAAQSDVGAVVEYLNGQANAPASNRQAWRASVTADIAERGYDRDGGLIDGKISPVMLCRAVQRQMDAVKQSVMVGDGGEFGQWAQACLTPDRRVINGAGASIGGALCQAVGAQLASADGTVFAFMGDGTVGFHFGEFETAVRNKTPFIVVIGHDARWNAEHQLQLREYGPDRLIGCQLDATRYDLAAQGLGCHGEYVTAADDLDAALKRAVSSGLPACVCVEIEGLPAPGGSAH